VLLLISGGIVTSFKPAKFYNLKIQSQNLIGFEVFKTNPSHWMEKLLILLKFKLTTNKQTKNNQRNKKESKWEAVIVKYHPRKELSLLQRLLT